MLFVAELWWGLTYDRRNMHRQKEYRRKRQKSKRRVRKKGNLSIRRSEMRTSLTVTFMWAVFFLSLRTLRPVPSARFGKEKRGKKLLLQLHIQQAEKRPAKTKASRSKIMNAKESFAECIWIQVQPHTTKASTGLRERSLLIGDQF